MNRRGLVAAVRIAFGVLALVAIGRQLMITVGLGGSVVSFFSYFTILSNSFAAVVLLAGGFRALTGRAPTPADDVVRGAAAVGMVVVGVVFAILLRGADLGPVPPWVNTVVHYVMPVTVALEWVAFPPAARLGVRQARSWLVFPVLYLIYTLVRGARVGWYPYPFLNPGVVGGYGGVAVYVAGIVTVFLIAAWATVAAGNARRVRPGAA